MRSRKLLLLKKFYALTFFSIFFQCLLLLSGLTKKINTYWLGKRLSTIVDLLELPQGQSFLGCLVKKLSMEMKSLCIRYSYYFLKNCNKWVFLLKRPTNFLKGFLTFLSQTSCQKISWNMIALFTRSTFLFQ